MGRDTRQSLTCPQGKHVEGNQEGSIDVKKIRTWRQYMNRFVVNILVRVTFVSDNASFPCCRRGGFNRSDCSLYAAFSLLIYVRPTDHSTRSSNTEYVLGNDTLIRDPREASLS